MYLYPAAYRREFGEEMISVFCEQRRSVGQDFRRRAPFYARELAGLLSGAVREHLLLLGGSEYWSYSRRSNMRRFPRSTILLMIVILAGVVLAIENARLVQMKYERSPMAVWDTMPGFFTFGFALVCLVALSGWLVLFALRRSGMHRLANVQPWPEQK
jgi:hypothetical protein